MAIRELPLYGADTPVLLPRQLPLLSAAHRKHLRPTKVKTLSHKDRQGPLPSLIDILNETDIQLERIAKQCGISVVGHTWGLYELSSVNKELRPKYEEYLPYKAEELEIPADCFVVADVDIVYDLQKIPRASERGRYIDGRMTLHRYTAGHRIFDMDLIQVRTGINRRVEQETGIVQRAEWLLDIEPRLGLPAN